jgi:hypothetical protein
VIAHGGWTVVTVGQDGDDKRQRSEGVLPEQGNLADWYRQKADECLRFAQEATTEDARDQWLKLANGWSQLALHQKR